jgi:cysteinyl-tRNA synthetase
MPKATDYISEMIEIISDLIAKNHAYVAEPAPGALAADVYFDVMSASENFGTLTGQKIEDMEAGARVAVDPRKRHPSDFVLWKGAKPEEPNWDSPWGIGRPGWHIECSAMSLSHLGKNFDIHGGGIDLRFPHHESEILQSECHTSHTPMANYWLHSGHLTVNKEKMSKSLDNFFLVREIMEEYSAPILRFYLLNGHYRSPIDFSDSNLKESMSAYRRLEGTYNRLVESESGGDQIPSELLNAIEICEKDFVSAMNDDFNTREGIAALFQLARVSNNFDFSKLNSDISKDLIDTFEKYGHNVLGLFNHETIDDSLEVEIETMLVERAKARENKDWSKSDSIRDKLKDMGIEIQDTPQGAKWRRV